MSQTEIRSTCCYCGVGCGVLIQSEAGRIISVRGDPEHPANYGRMCSKGLNLAATTASDSGRALVPSMRLTRDSAPQTVSWDEALDSTADGLARIIRLHGPDAVALYVSGQLLTEEYYQFNKLAKGLIGTNNIDTNSRLCMSSAVTAYKQALGADAPPGCYEDLELADCVLMAGSNMAYAHPVLFRRLEAAKAARPDTRWIVVDPRRTDTAAMADLHLAIQPGTDVALFHGMLHHLIWEGLLDRAFIDAHTERFDALKEKLRDYTPRMAADLCGIAEQDLRLAAEWFGRAPAAMSLYCMGLNQSSHGTDKNLALINLHLATGQIGRPGTGPFSLTGQPNAMGGREVGGMATMLAAHREIHDAGHRQVVADHWQIPVERLSARPGLTAVELFNALHEGKVKAVWIVCTNPAHSMPDLTMVHEALQAAELVIVQDAFAATETTVFADILLPAASWGEKDGTVSNSERRISRVRAAVPPPGQARADGWIVREVAQRLETLLYPGQPTLFGASTAAAVFDEHCQLTAGRSLDYSGLSYALLETEGPQQWPLPKGQRTGQARRYTDGHFATANGRARFHAPEYQTTAESTTAHYPFHLISGRLRDQWHGMSRSGRVAQLFSHHPEPMVQMHPEDASRRTLNEGDLVRLTSKRGKLVLPVQLSVDVPPGCVFVPMHWGSQFTNSPGVNVLTLPTVDAASRQPELKHAAIRLEKVTLPWRVVIALRVPDLTASRIMLGNALKHWPYAALSLASTDVLLLKAAGERSHSGCLSELMQSLNLMPGPDVLVYQDDRRGVIKRVAWQGSRITGLVWASPLPTDWNQASQVVARLLEDRDWEGPRLAVFAPTGQVPSVREHMVCQCQQVSERAIRQLMTQGATLPDIQQRLGCGTVCGSCLPELKRIVLQPQLA
ncbi:molybdopterin-dependent oxidoreductase [Leeia sp.]|uniref:nitrate reductase n=1 Tax=Leeia sp. TaxID=2884678 RepID=UPI0035AF0607